MNRTFFLTGVTGFLGTNLAIDLLAKGFIVKGLTRSAKKHPEINHENLELVRGNLSEDLSDVLQDVDVVVHMAGETRQNFINYADYRKANVENTRYLFESSLACGVEQFIFISTANTLKLGSSNNPGGEEEKVKDPQSVSMYAQSKLEAENYLLSQTDKMEVIILNPTFILGAYDRKPTSGALLLMGWKKRIIFYPKAGKNFVNVRDVCQAIIHAMDYGRNGENYLIAHENMSFRAFFRKLNKITAQNPLMIPVPQSFLMVMGYVGNVLRAFRINTALSVRNMKMICVDNYYDNAKSKTELKVKYHSTEEAVKEAIQYFEDKGIGG